VIWWRNIKDLVLSFYYPSGQFFLVSFPNSGRTWLMYMLRNILKEAGKENIYIEDTHDTSEIIIENGTRQDPNLIFNFTSRFRYVRAKVIFLARDPRDVITSNFHQVTNRSKNPFKFNSKSEFVMHDIYGFKRVIHFFNIWYNNRKKPQDFLFVKYENLLESTLDLKKIITFLNVDIPDELIERIYLESTASKMREKEKKNQLQGFSNFGKEANKLKVRKAIKGSYATELTFEDIKFCNKEMEKLNSYFGYKI
jgi:hypothetical protein|tara:strand:+ start:435 stop:1193 length:759 start_codon:yes stop_codon:yes gene_type:complete